MVEKQRIQIMLPEDRMKASISKHVPGEYTVFSSTPSEQLTARREAQDTHALASQCHYK